MPLTPAQLATLKAHIAASPDLTVHPNTGDGNTEVAKLLNLTAAPAFVLWRTRVPLAEIAVSLNGSELGGLSSLNHTRLQTVITLTNAAGGANPSKSDNRAFFDDIFSGAGGVNTRASLLALWKKSATRLQKLFAAGTGTDVSPATPAANADESYQVSAGEVETARNLP